MHQTTTFLVLFLCSMAGAAGLDPGLTAKADSLFDKGPDRQETILVGVEGVPLRYFATTAATLPCSIDKVDSLLKRYDEYPNLHTYLIRSSRVVAADADNAYFMVIGVRRARAWFLGNITIGEDNQRDRRITFRQSPMDSLRNWCRNEVEGRTRIEFRYFRMQYRLRDLGDGRTRLALTAYVEPLADVPRWLVRTTVRKVFPRFMREIEASLSSAA